VSVLGEFLACLEGFEWDPDNSENNWRHHQVRQGEAEQALLNRPVVLAVDVKHSQAEARFLALGRTDSGRHLAIVFTTRGSRVRVISARPMSRAERRVYGQVEATPQTDS
jgi:uncharacterized DUF497 family protein